MFDLGTALDQVYSIGPERVEASVDFQRNAIVCKY